MNVKLVHFSSSIAHKEQAKCYIHMVSFVLEKL
jgi:hypothetical protein